MKTERRIFQNVYLDSVTLMRISANLMKLEGVAEASVLMGTPSNMDLLVQSGLLAEPPMVKSSDLVVVIKGDEGVLDNAFTEAAEALRPKESGTGEVSILPPPTSLRCAVAENADSSLALISVPGAFAAAEALKAIGAGLNVMIFSDNVPVWQEVALKRAATARGLLVMGPDCGTSIINGAPLAFANAVRRGSIGIVGASGTGIQQVTCLIHGLGQGISQAIGTGGHDLSAEVGGLTMLAGIDALARDDSTKIITLISKPPSREVGTTILKAAAATGKPVVVNFFGADTAALIATLDASACSRFCIATTLEEAAHRSVALAESKAPTFTNCLGDIYSNAPAGSSNSLETPFKSTGNTIVDLGDDVFTRGKPHPMIDPTPRNGRLIQEMADPTCGVLLLDVVLGYGSHEDPAGELAAAIAKGKAATANPPICIASVCGTDQDPQHLDVQCAKLEAQGVVLCQSNAQAAALAACVLMA